MADAPGCAAPAAAIHILREMARFGDRDAPLGACRILASELRLGEEDAIAGAPSIEALVADPDVPKLVRAYALGFAPRLLATEPERCKDIGSAIYEGDLSSFRRLLAMQSPMETEALRAYLLSAAAASLSMPAFATTAAYRLDLADRIVDTAVVVPGDASDSDLRFGRDFLLRVAPTGLAFAIHHEMGHIYLDAARGLHETTWQADRPGTGRQLLAALPGLLAAATAAAGTPALVGDARRWQSDGGLTVMMTEEPRPLGSYLHLSVTDGAGSIALTPACGLALAVVQAMGVAPESTAAALSRRGVFHLGLPLPAGPPEASGAAGPDRSHPSDADADAWWSRLGDLHRTVSREEDLQYVLGMASRPTTAFALTRGALDDQRTGTEERDKDPSGRDASTLAASLQTAVRCGDSQWAARLVGGGAGAGAATSSGTTADVAHLADLGQSCAVMSDGQGGEYFGANATGLLEVVAVLHRAGLDLSVPINERGDTLLTNAAGRSVATTAALLAIGLDVAQVNARGETALSSAVQFGESATVELLLVAGAHPGRGDNRGTTPLHLAATRGDVDIIGLLVAYGAAVAAADASGVTPLMLGSRAGAVEALLAAGADREAATTSGQTAVMIAAGRGEPEVVQALIAGGADVNRSSDKGQTALLMAVQSFTDGRLTTVRALLEAGADANEENDDGVSPLRSTTDDGVIALLVAHGAVGRSDAQAAQDP